jgi:hypothetical protein
MAVGNDRFRLVRVDDYAGSLHHNPDGLFDAAASDTG